MKYIKSGLIAALLSMLAGCASMTFAERSVDEGRYAFALHSVAYFDAAARELEGEKVSKKIKEKAGPNFQNIFAEQTYIYIKEHEKNSEFYSSMYRYLQSAVKYDLLNGQQVERAMLQLQRELAISVVANPDILDKNIKKLFPDLPQFMVEAREAEYQSALGGRLPMMQTVRAYSNAKSVDAEKARRLLPSLRARASDIARTPENNGSQLTEMLSAHAAANDSDVTASVRRYITNSTLGKFQLKQEVESVFPDLAKQELAKREILIKIATESSDPFVDELPDALAEIDEWITVDDEAVRKLNIARLRFSERESSPIIRTMTVQNLDFLTLILIPKNASVLYDTATTNYEISWSMSVSDSASKGSKVISGKSSAQRVECSNIRFRNVFGGEGALGSVPSDIQGYCAANSSTDFSAMRKDSVRRIAQEIVNVIRNGDRALEKKKISSS